MNSNKTILTLLLVIVVLGAAFALQQWLAQRGGQENSMYFESIEGFAKENISEITLAKGDQALQARKENEQWKSDQAFIDATLMQSLLENLLNPEDMLLISQNTQQHASYEVTAENATIAMLKNPSGEKKFYIGSPESGNYYVRIDGTDEVWGVEEMPSQVFDVTLAQWLDKKLLAVDEQNITTLVIDKSGNLITLQQRDNSWFVDGGEQPLDKTSFSDLLMQLESLVATGMIADEQLGDFPTNPSLKLIVNTQGATPTTIELFTGKDTIMAKVVDRPGNFEISQSTFDDLNLNRSDLLFAPSPTPSQ
jgi:hypothetical protein